jgi:hypothetical protein
MLPRSSLPYTFMMSSVLALTMSSSFFTKPSVVFCTLSSRVFLVSLGKSNLMRTTWHACSVAVLLARSTLPVSFRSCPRRSQL